MADQTITSAEPTPNAAARPASEGEPDAPLLRVDNLTLRFGGVTALSHVSFDVLPGELYAAIGPNGAGKTSIFNCLSGVYRPQTGSMLLEGHQLAEIRPTRAAELGIGRTFQNLGLFENLTLVDNLLLGRHHLMRTGFLAGALWWGKARREELVHRVAVEDIIDLLELSAYRTQRVGMLPYGIQKRIELGRALAMHPKLLLLDEPAAGMSVEETEDMVRYILEIRDALKLSIILVEHDMHVVMDIAERVMALDFGEVLTIGKPSEVQADERVIEAYLGGS